MKIEQIYTGCLAQGAYYIESEGEVAIIDPLRETKPYIEKAKAQGHKIKYILETHFHADFVSGHVTLAEQSGAKIIFGPTANTKYESIIAKDNQEFQLGKISIKVLHTPGHTQESSCYLLLDENKKEQALFSGDTLFIGDVGRPDLAVKTDLTKEDLAGMLFDSLRNKIMTLPKEITIYPAHGAGSACGKNMSKETSDSLENQLKTNYALNSKLTKEEFIKEVTTGLAPPPQYFPKNALMNKNGYDAIDDVLEKGLVSLSPEKFEEIVNETSALMLDTRAPQIFKNQFIPNSINIGIDGGFAPWVGALIPDLKQEIVLICEPGREEEIITRLSRVGYDNTIGFLDGGIEAWINSGKETDSIISIPASELENLIDNDITILDVRKESEYLSEHIDNEKTLLFPLTSINDNLNTIDKTKTYHIHCGGGYRSMIACSILKSRGFDNVIDIAGGFAAIKETQIPLTAFVCPSTLV